MITDESAYQLERYGDLVTNMGSTNSLDYSSARLYYETNNFFFRDAKLRIVDTREDARTTAGNTQKYMKVVVRNKGHRAALSCKAQLKVIFSKSADPWSYPTNNTYNITWGKKSDKSDISEELKEIGPDYEGELHLVFGDQMFGSSSAGIFHRTKYAEISTISHLSDNVLMEEDSFAEGDYLIRLVVTWHGGSTKKYFMIHVDNDVQKQTIRKISTVERLRLMLRL